MGMALDLLQKNIYIVVYSSAILDETKIFHSVTLPLVQMLAVSSYISISHKIYGPGRMKSVLHLSGWLTMVNFQ